MAASIPIAAFEWTEAEVRADFIRPARPGSGRG